MGLPCWRSQVRNPLPAKARGLPPGSSSSHRACLVRVTSPMWFASYCIGARILPCVHPKGRTRVKRVTKMTEKVAVGVLSGAVKVSGFFTRSLANTKAGKKFFSLLPGEMVLATLDGFSRICDAVEVAGKNVMSTSGTVTTEFVSHRYGEEASKATSEGLDAAGHAFGTAWAVFKIRKALNPKSALKPTALAKSAAKAAATAAAADKKAKSSK
ncbi:hypothetical protein MTR67_008015 [Solanum verrucosum]|uniref:Senescence domain-containing protein n=1 Tax=Solanum verrucosum TaxID=315347 RepID=A0AAF0Q320_SOLVR|nr:hypothetical protein MTR67_008015 [Solanum verrucosum]